MSKPLELTIYPRPRMKAHYQGPAPYLDIESGNLTSEHAANMLAGAKRLTNTELAAEAYRQMARAIAVVGAVCVGDKEFAPADTAGDTPLSVETVRLRVMKRFATHPHYFEATEPESGTE